ncbi:MAG: hypothetical protein ABID38_06600 [Candidatus Diapherotrites archaeon]
MDKIIGLALVLALVIMLIFSGCVTDGGNPPPGNGNNGDDFLGTPPMPDIGKDDGKETVPVLPF